MNINISRDYSIFLEYITQNKKNTRYYLYYLLMNHSDIDDGTNIIEDDIGNMTEHPEP